MKVYILYQDGFAERVAGHLVNDIHFCTACGNGCNNCRLTYGSHAGSIDGYDEVGIGEDVEGFIEEPEKLLPKHAPRADIMIAIGLHPDILAAVPSFAQEHGMALVVPVDDKKWCPFGLQKQLAEECAALGTEHAFPRPFCDLHVNDGDETRPTIRRFMDEFKVGRPRIELQIKNDRIVSGYVVRSQPCGAAYYIIQQLRHENIFDQVTTLDERISLAHHSFPCSASMENDPILGDSPLHVAGYLARDAVHDAIERELGIVEKQRFHKGQPTAPV